MKCVWKACTTKVAIDGTLWVLIAVFGTTQTIFTSEEAYKYVDPFVLFWIKTAMGIMFAAVSALKAFRSTTYAKSQTETTVVTK